MTAMVKIIAIQTAKAPFRYETYPDSAMRAIFTRSNRARRMFAISFYDEVANFWGSVNA